MNLEELKNKIESNDTSYPFIIFKLTDIDFIPLQYIDKIRDILKVDVKYNESSEELSIVKTNIFGITEDSSINVLEVDTFSSADKSLLSRNNTFIICKKLSEDAAILFSNNIIEIPKLESWQIKDYVYSMAEGVPTDRLDKLIDICKNNIFRLDKEVKKLSIFSTEERKYIFDHFVSDKIFSDLSNHNIFDLSNAIMKKDFRTITQLYKEIDNIDCEPLGLLTTLYNNFRNVISVQLSNNPTAEGCGMSSKQFWAVKYSCGFYTKEELLKIFGMLSDIDRRIKTGTMPVNILVDYLITHILSS